MKCPYQKNTRGEFLECTIQCPACKYEVEEREELCGKKHYYQSVEDAIECGMMWRSKRLCYTIVGCKFVDNLIKPTDQNITNVKNVQEVNTSVMIKKSVF